ncbi:hypothetical protein QR680_008904 [Steinernema hermaphroditum]|uniref:Uncharacterized protein n=1 Tax=Steinernema hermaphroditum TaxID=289476 RepID=A0AA39IKS6_9BILA|nr:hypothetical protein QR680_008904 [Steinernema hermaphroditum]
MSSTEDVLVGSAMLLISGVCLLANLLVLSTIASYSEFYTLSSYKIMLLMGVFDVSQLCSHFLTGAFTIAQYEAPFWAHKVLGVMISPTYECYVFVTILLAFNRFLFMCSPWKETIIFSTRGNKIWLLITLLLFLGFAGLHSSNLIFSSYKVAEYTWSYDHSYPWSEMRETVIFYYQIFGILIAWLFYIAITVNLLRYKNEVDSVTRFTANRKILLHAFVIVVYSTLMNITWHKIDLVLSPGKMQNFVVNLTWIGSSGLSPFLCLVLNKQVRRKITYRARRTLFPSTKVANQLMTVTVTANVRPPVPPLHGL